MSSTSANRKLLHWHWATGVIFTICFIAKGWPAVCPHEDDYYPSTGATKYHANLSATMLHQTLTWPREDIEGTMLYTVEIRYPDFEIGDKACWHPCKGCENITVSTCVLDDCYDEYLNYVRVVGLLRGMAQTSYVTDPILYNKYKNLTLTTPYLLLKRVQKKVVFYPKYTGDPSKVMDDDKVKLRFQVQYWNGNETGVRYNKFVSKKAVEDTIAISWPRLCARVRLFVDEIGYEPVKITSPWSQEICSNISTAEPTEQAAAIIPEKSGHRNVVISIVVTICVFVTIVAAFITRRIWENVRNAFGEKPILPEAVAHIIDHEECASSNENSIIESFEAFDVIEENQGEDVSATADLLIGGSNEALTADVTEIQPDARNSPSEDEVPNGDTISCFNSAITTSIDENTEYIRI